MTENETPSLWNKTTSELTVADQLKVTAVVTAVVVVAPVVAGAVAAAVGSVARKFRKPKVVEVTSTTEEK